MLPLVAPQLGFDLNGIWQDARAEVGIKHEALAALMGLSASRLSDQLAGRAQQHLSMQRVLLLATDPDGRKFLRVLCLKLATVNGFDLDALYQIGRIERLATKLIDRVQKRVPVAADLRDVRAKETA